MCRNCYSILLGNCLPHSEVQCPLTQSLYCTSCGVYGHLSSPSSPCPSLTVLNRPDVIYQTLVSHGIRPPSKKGSISLKKMLLPLSKQKGQRLIILPSS